MKRTARWALALRLLVRDWRAGELRILAAALVIAVAASTAISFFTDRVGRGMVMQSADFLGGDLALTSPNPVNHDWLAKAGKLGLEVSETLEFSSVVISGEALQLSSVRAIDEHFPLRGSLRTSPEPFVPDTPSAGIPASGEAWAEARLLTQLGISVGGQVEVGNHILTVTRVLTFEPGRVGDMFGVAPRLLIRNADVAATGVVQPGSRLSYQYLFSGTTPALARYRAWLKDRLEAGQELVGVHEGRRTVGAALERAERYLGLSVLIAVVLAGVAIAMAARRYSERHFDMSAMLRCLGTQQKDVLGLYIPQLLLIGILSSMTGCVIGWLAQYGLLYLLQDLLPVTSTGTSLRPVLVGFSTGLVVLAGFALPPILRLREVPPLRVLNRDLKPLPTSAWLIYGAAAGAVIALMWRYTGSWTLTLTVLAGAAAVVLVLAILSLALLVAGRRVNAHVGTAWRFGLNNLWRRPRTTVTQVLAFAFILMAMAIIAVVRSDLLTTWQAQLPEDVHNHFVINILPDEVVAASEFLDAKISSSSALYPMVRGRLVTINDKPVREAVTKEASGDNALNRELNLTWMEALQEDNRIVSGQWWDTNGKTGPQVSVESRLAGRLGIHIGDDLSFAIAGETLVAKVTSIRSVQWDSFRPNFYMVFPPGVLEDLPATYMASFYLEESGKNTLVDMVRNFPAITVLELDLIIKQVQKIFGQVALAVEYVLIFVLLAGLAVLFAALQASLDERLYEGALLRALGGSRAQLRAGHIAEFASIGLIAGLVAASGTECVIWLLYSEVFQLEYSIKWQTWLILPILGALLVGCAGYYGTRPVVERSPLILFRER